MALVGFIVGSRVISDNSFLTHFATGRLILESGSVPTVDVYSATAAGEPWTVQSWLPSVIYRLLFENVGFWSIRLLHGALTGTITWMLWRLSQPARHPAIRVLLVGLAVVVGASLWTPRPLLFGLLGLAFVLQVLQKQRAAWMLLPVMWLWVNSNGSFPLAVLIVGATLVGTWLDDRALPRHELSVLGWTLAGTALGAINPLGLRLLIFPFELISNSAAVEGVAEWRSPSFDSPTQWVFLGLVFAFVASARLGGTWRSLIPGFGMTVMALLALRNLGPASLVLATFSAFGLVWKTDLDGSERGVIAKAVVGTALGGIVVVSAMIVGSTALDLEDYPVEEVDWLEERSLVANPDVMLIQRDSVGNYLEARFGDEASVFVDDRFDFYPQDVLDDHRDLFFGQNIEEILGRREADAVLWEAESPLAEWLRSDDGEDLGWAVALESDDWIVAVRNQAG